MLYNRYEKEQKYINGVPASPAEYRKGDYLGQYEFNSIEDCENTAMFRWIGTDKTVCSGYSLCVEEKKQVSYDDGQTWEDTTERRAGRVIKERAEECGWKVLERWELVGTTCLGFDAVHQYIKQYSYDMGETWENSDPPIYKYSAKEEFSEECVLASEPLTFEVTLPSAGTVNIDVWEHVYKYVDRDDDIAENWIRYYINYGDFDVNEREEFMELSNDHIDGGSAKHFIDEVKCKDHAYRTAGTYTIKIWGYHRSIKGLSGPEGMTYKVTSWGDFTGKQVLNTNTGLVSYIEDTLFRIDLRGDKLVDLVADNHQAFSKKNSADRYFGLERFIIRNANITSLPNRLLTNARALKLFQCVGTPINSVPNDLFANCNELFQLMDCFKNSINLVTAPSFEGTKEELYLHSAFEGCTSLQSALITDKIVTAYSAFKGCTSLTGTVFNNCRFDNVHISVIHSNVIYDINHYLDKKATSESYNGDLQGCFMNAKLDGNPLNNCSFNETITSSNIIDASNMFEGSGVTTFDIGFFNKPANLTECFFRCPNLRVTGAFLPLDDYGVRTTESMNGYTLDYMFATSGITNMPNIFINVKDKVQFDYGCYNCESLETIDSKILTTFGNTKNISIYKAFANCHNLTSHSPISASGQNVWDLYPYTVNGKYVRTLCFQGSYNMSNFSEIIAEWGGAVLPDPNLKPVILELTGETVYLPLFGKGWVEWGDDPYMDYEDFDEHIYMEENYQDYDYSVWFVKDCINHTYTDGLTTHTVKAYFDTYNIITVNLDAMGHTSGESTTKIISFGSGLYNPHYTSIPIKGVEQIPGHQEIRAGSVSPIEKLNQLPNLTFLGKDEGALRTFTTTISWANSGSWAGDMNKLEGIDPDFLASAANLNSVRNLFAYCTKLKSIPDGFLSKNTLLTDVYGMCYECSSLTTIPTDFLSTCKQIQDFGSAFRDCPELTGNTPVNDDGTKWWERQGKEGYPDSITSSVCFQGCTKLNDYNNIPMSWR